MAEIKSNELTEELNEINGGAGHPRPVPVNWKAVYGYLMEHKEELPEYLQTQLDSFNDWYDPKFETFVYNYAKTNAVVYAAWNYGHSH